MKKSFLLISSFVFATIILNAQSLKKEITLIPFFPYKNLILIKATIQDQEGYLILDTGEPDLVLNSKYFKGWSGSTNNIIVHGVEGAVQEVQFQSIDFELYGLQWKNINAKIVDLQHLHPARSLPLLGLIGTQLLIDYEIIINYHQHELALIPVRSGMEIAGAVYMQKSPDLIIPLKMKGHIPAIELQMENGTSWVGIDSGSELFVLNKRIKRQLRSSLAPKQQVQLQSVGSGAAQIQLFELSNIILSNMLFPPMEVIFLDFSPLNLNMAGHHLDGILGTPFLKEYLVGINCKTKTLSVWYREGQEPLVKATREVEERE